MRWVIYVNGDGERRAGLVVGESIHGLESGTTVEGLLDDGEAMATAAVRATTAPAEVIDLDGADLRAPLRPTQVRDFLTFLDHLRNARGGPDADIGEIWEQMPAFYFSNVAAVIGPHDPVPISPGAEQFDFELEVAAVIGRPGSNLRPDEAADHIVGFTIMCDWSARDIQYREMAFGLGPAKGKDGATTIGPMLVTVDELEPYRVDGTYDLGMRAWIGDEQVTDGSMAQMDWSWGEMLAYASRGTTLLTGDVIGSGTVPLGCLVERARTEGDAFRGWLQPGDVVRLEVDELGSIAQEIVSAPPLHRLRTGF